MSTAPPLTHHEIMGLIGPFSRSGRVLDLAGSDRAARRLRFKPQPVADGLSARWVLEPGASGAWQLTREVFRDRDAPAAAGAPLTAALVASGAPRDDAEAAIAALLTRVDAVPPAVHWGEVEGIGLALSHRLPGPSRQGDPETPVLAEARARIAGFELTLKVPRTHSMPAELTLSAAAPLPAGTPNPLPEDLLAVLGLAWARLSLARGAWRSTIELKRREPRRSADAEAKLRQTVAHLARTLAEPPQRFHQRHAAARWRVSLRRGVPLLGCIALIVGAAAVPVFDLTEGVLRMLVFNAPPLLMVWFFSRREMPRIELPPLPRPVPLAAWPGSGPAATALER